MNTDLVQRSSSGANQASVVIDVNADGTPIAGGGAGQSCSVGKGIVMTWKTMESVPKDKTIFLYWDGVIVFGRWDFSGWKIMQTTYCNNAAIDQNLRGKPELYTLIKEPNNAKIMSAIESVITESVIDYPAGRECGHNVIYDEDFLKQAISKILEED